MYFFIRKTMILIRISRMLILIFSKITHTDFPQIDQDQF